MGNYSCKIIPNTLPLTPSKSTKVILPTGEIKRLQEPTQAVEIMLEAPNFFIVNTKSLKIGKRFVALAPEDILQKANIYVMFPMTRNNSLVTADDVATVFITVNSVLKRGSKGNKIRVLPRSEGLQEVAVPRLSLEGLNQEGSISEFRHRTSISRSKKPLLETIEEEPASSR